MKIYVDADACPVQQEIVQLSNTFHMNAIFVKSYAHFSHDIFPEHIKTIYVDAHSESADYKIVQLTHRSDIVITQDYGLASLCLAKGCYVFHHKGFQYTNKNIETLLAQRHASAQARKSGKRTRGPKPFTAENKHFFLKRMTHFLENNVIN